MKLVSLFALLFLSSMATSACITAYNPVKVTPDAKAPLVDPRPGGCNVDVFEDGQKDPRKSVVIGRIVLNWPSDKIKEQGPEGAIKTLKASACEQGAFMIEGMRALPDGDGGMVYEADLATLLGDDGKPVNLHVEKPAADQHGNKPGDKPK
jgi:hypothetical protein